MKASYRRIDISPPIGIRLGGYAHRLGKPSTKIHDPLYSRLLYISDNKEDILIIQSDLLGIYKKDANYIKKKIHEKTGLSIENIFLTTIHSHSSPETIIPMWPNTFPYTRNEEILFEKWWNETIEKIVNASEEVINNPSYFRVMYGVFKVENLCVNRTFGENGFKDENLYTLLFYNNDKRIFLLNYACHPVCNTDMGISADYPGAIHRYLIEKGFETIFIIGSAGDINPLKKGREYIEYMGRRISNTVLNNINGMKNLDQSNLSIIENDIVFPFRQVNAENPKRRFEEVYRECIDKLDDPECIVKLLYADEEYEISKRNEKEKRTIIHAFKIGDVMFLTVPGELFAEIDSKIRKFLSRNGIKLSIVSNYSEDYIGYIPTVEAFRNNKYEARLARWSRVTIDAEKIFLEETKSLVKELL